MAFESLGYIGVSLEGKSCLAGLGNKFINCIENLETLIQVLLLWFRHYSWKNYYIRFFIHPPYFVKNLSYKLLGELPE